MNWLRKLEGSRLAIAGLFVAAVLFVAVNVLANTAFRGTQVDLTEGKLYTLSDSTRHVMASLKDPVHLRLYFSRQLGEVAPRFGAYYARVRELLERYVTMSNGNLQLELLEPEPFSDAEDRAVADGLQGVPLNQAGEQGYFGLAGSNSTDGHEVIPFFNLEREPFLEYDLTKMIYGLANPDRPVLGVMSTLPAPRQAMGPHGGGQLPIIFDQLREFFDVEDVNAQTPTIDDKTKTLMVVDLQSISPDALHAVDKFVHNGGTALVFVDPVIESSQGAMPPGETASADDVAKLLRTWGVELVRDKVAGDIDAARRVSTGERGGVVGDYVAWLSLGSANLDTADPVMANVERLNLGTSGVLQPVEGTDMTVTPLAFTGPRGMLIDADKVRVMPDIMELLRNYQPGNKPLTLIARVSGQAPLAFPATAAGDAQPEGNAQSEGDSPAQSDAQPKGDTQSTSDTQAKDQAQPAAGDRKPIQVIVVADADMLYDRFWLQSSDFFGQRVDVPTASNADFVINALENLSDAEALIGLRGRGTSYRPFTLVEELRRDAEAQYRVKEQQLQQQLKDLQQQLAGVEKHEGDGGEVMLSADDKATIERFRGEMLKVRKELRDVQHALRSDIEQLEQDVTFANIAAVPLLLGGIGGGVALFRRIRRSRAKRQRGQG